ncbi:hypothetical protein CMI42_05590 [Candidatus Pacearchaeota archaeon]|jgi:hypothetical protein|nr:hypothetical protein [Candidatus Pacearchaeota archaeon]|tara:strand:+ start:450 stop:707 length:258 start_codon:yes stop_codon:yes gene_type:complete
MKKEKFIAGAVEKPGTLHRQLGIGIDGKIPFTLLRAIMRAEVGDQVKNPSKSGKRVIFVTRLLKKRANLAINLKNISKRRYRQFR